MGKITNFNNLLKGNFKLLTSLIIGIFTPWILTLMFMISIRIPVNFIMIIFNIFNLTFEIPFLGNGYWLCLIIWAVPGLLIGILLQDIKTSLIISIIGIGINYVLYLLLIIPYSTSLPLGLIDPLISPNLYLNISIITPLALLLQILIHSFVLPIMILFTLIGYLINPKPQITTDIIQLKLKKIGNSTNLGKEMF